MSDFVYVGKIVNTHGIRGEIRLLSKFSYKNRIFQKGKTLYIGRERVPEVITGYRVHKCFDMITLEGYSDINEVLKYKGALCYALRQDLELAKEEYLEEELIGLPVFVGDSVYGSVLRVEHLTEKNSVLWITYQGGEHAVPFVEEFVDVHFQEGRIYIRPIKGLFDEN